MIELIEPEAPAQPADAPAAAVAVVPPAELVKLDLQAVALAHFGDWRGDVAKVRANLSTLALDLSIPARVADAKTLRMRLIGTPRAEVRKTSAALKSKLAAVSKAVGTEADAAVAAYDDAESLITPQIEAAEQRIEAERKAREAAEAERLAGLRKRVDEVMATWLARCDAEGMVAARVAQGIEALRAVQMPDDLGDVAGYWKDRHATTLGAMEQRRVDLAAAEVAAEQARLRAEQERVAKIQQLIASIQAAATQHTAADPSADIAETRAVVAAVEVGPALCGEFSDLAAMARTAALMALDALHAQALAREQHDADEARRAAEAAAVSARFAAFADAMHQASEQAQATDAVVAVVDLNEQPGALTPVAQGGVAGNPVQPEPVAASTVGDLAAAGAGDGSQSAATPPTPAAAGVIGNPPFAPAAEPTLTLGAVNEWLAPITLSSAGLELLGITHSGRRKNALLYHEADKARIVAALREHLKGLA